MEQNGLVEILKVEGVMAQGYGLNPRIVMRDKRLTPEAKCIYSYFASFAGSGNTAFPSRATILEELGMSKDRYYRHLDILVNHDYIRIDKIKNEKGLFTRNVYTLVTNPEPTPEQLEKPTKQKSPKGRITKTAGKTIEPGPPAEETFSKQQLSNQLGIEVLKAEVPQKHQIIENILNAVFDMATSEELKVAGSIKKKEAIQEIIKLLNGDHVRSTIKTLETAGKLTNPKAYIQTCIVNSIYTLPDKKQSAPSQKEKRQAEEDQHRLQQRQQQEDQYQRYPKLKELDDQICEIAKQKSIAIIKGDRALVAELDIKIDPLNQKREQLIKTHKLE